MNDLRAAIFDMDGTLVDNMRFHADAWLKVLARHGTTADRDTLERRFAGRKNEELIPELLGRKVPDDEIRRIADEKESAYRELYRPHLKPLDGLFELLDALEKAGVKLAVASAAPLENRALVLDGLALRPRFSKVVGAEDAKRGKPHPDIFLAASAALNVPAAECVAFEDAVNGVVAAKAAGMEVVGVPTATSAEALQDAGARWIMRDFRALPGELAARLGLNAGGGPHMKTPTFFAEDPELRRIIEGALKRDPAVLETLKSALKPDDGLRKLIDEALRVKTEMLNEKK